MYKVIIADDEKNIRQGLKAILNWQEYGFEIADEAANGEEALEKILAIRPDLVLMDIRMPKCYGLDVIKNAREQGFDGKYIILSGYSDFSYAQKAIQYGVEFYLTKPIDEDELEDVVKKLKQDLDKEQSAEDNIRLYRDKARELIIHEIITGTAEPRDYKNMGQQELRDLGLGADAYQVIVYEKYGLSMEDPQYDFLEMFKSLEADEFSFDKFEEEGKDVVLLKGKRAVRKLELFLERYNQDSVMPGSPMDTLFIAYGRVVSQVQEIRISYEEAMLLAHRRFFCEQGKHTLGYMHLPNFPEGGSQSLGNGMVERYCQEIFHCIQMSKRGKLAETMRNLEMDLYNANVEKEEAASFMLDLYMQIQEKVARTWPEQEGLFHHQEMIAKFGNAFYLYEITMLIMNQIKELMDKIGGSDRDSVISDILYYVDNNFRSNITLEAIAPLFGYSSAYIGKLFTKTVGQTFNTYLDQKRIQKSKELLQDSGIKVYEIAERVGYGNVDYFHKKFKKYEGMSPARYRKNVQENS